MVTRPRLPRHIDQPELVVEWVTRLKEAWMFGLKHSLLVGVVAFLLALPGCVQLAEDQPTPTPIPTPAESNKPVYDVRKGSIVQTVKALGRVAASQEATLYFRQDGRLRRLYVETNQKVKEGDLLAELETGTLRTQIAEAKLNLDIAQIKLTQAMQKSGSDTSAVPAALASIEKAQADYTKAVGELNKLRSGAVAADVKSAEQAISSASAALAKSQTDLDKLKRAPLPEDVRAAELGLEQAKNDLWASQIRRDATCGGGPGTSCQAADASVASAETGVSKAQAALDKAKQPTKPEDLANAQRTIDSNKSQLDAARAKLDQVNSGAKASDVSSAESSIKSAQAALDSAKANYDQVVVTNSKGGDFDVQIQQKQVELVRVALQVLEDELSIALIKAPFDGVVTQTQGREGDTVVSFTQVVTIANPTGLQIALELSPVDLAKVQMNQEAVIVFTAFPTDKIPAKVVFLPSLVATADAQLPSSQRTVKIDFDAMPNRTLDLGSLANVTINTQVKDDVLILPNTAIRTFGGRKFVRLATSNGRNQEVDVEVGINNETETEIVKGLKEGQKIVGQ